MERTQLDTRLETLAQTVLALAQECRGDTLALLALLRSLEQSHRTIQEELFQASLPNTRHGLYKLIKDIEETGGWPYIARLKLQALTLNLPPEEIEPPVE